MARTSPIDTPHAPVLFLHQTPRSWDEFREVMMLLSGELNCVAMDLPGMGGSSKTSDTPSIEDYADAACQVIKAFGLKKVTLCGHHTGGVVAIEVAALRPDIVQSLILSSTPWVDAGVRAARAKKPPIDTVTRSRQGLHLLDLWSQRSEFYPENVEFMDRFICDALRSNDPADGHLAIGRYEMEARIGEINCPVLLIEHSKDPFASAYTEALKNHLPGSEVEYIEEGRVALEVTAKAFAQKVFAWVERRKEEKNED